MEQLVFVILVAAVGLLRLIMQAAEKKRNQEAARRADGKEQPNAPVERAPATTEEERIRRFMEALGVPTTTAPTPPRRREVTPRTPRAPRGKIMPVDSFPAPRTDAGPMTVPPPVLVAETSPTPAPVVTVSRPTTPIARAADVQAAPRFEVTDVRWGSEEAAEATAASAAAAIARPDVVAAQRNWATRLANAESLREAIVLREIFGPPRSLETFEPL